MGDVSVTVLLITVTLATAQPRNDHSVVIRIPQIPGSQSPASRVLVLRGPYQSSAVRWVGEGNVRIAVDNQGSPPSPQISDPNPSQGTGQVDPPLSGSNVRESDGFPAPISDHGYPWDQRNKGPRGTINTEFPVRPSAVSENVPSGSGIGTGNNRLSGNRNIGLPETGNVKLPGRMHVELIGRTNGGNIDSSGGGNVGSPGNGNVPSPGRGNIRSSAGGNAGSPGNGNIGSPGSGNAESPGSGNIGSPRSWITGSTGNANGGSTRNRADQFPSNDNIGYGRTGKTNTVVDGTGSANSHQNTFQSGAERSREAVSHAGSVPSMSIDPGSQGGRAPLTSDKNGAIFFNPNSPTNEQQMGSVPGSVGGSIPKSARSGNAPNPATTENAGQLPYRVRHRPVFVPAIKAYAPSWNVPDIQPNQAPARGANGKANTNNIPNSPGPNLPGSSNVTNSVPSSRNGENHANNIPNQAPATDPFASSPSFGGSNRDNFPSVNTGGVDNNPPVETSGSLPVWPSVTNVEGPNKNPQDQSSSVNRDSTFVAFPANQGNPRGPSRPNNPVNTTVDQSQPQPVNQGDGPGQVHHSPSYQFQPWPTILNPENTGSISGAQQTPVGPGHSGNIPFERQFSPGNQFQNNPSGSSPSGPSPQTFPNRPGAVSPTSSGDRTGNQGRFRPTGSAFGGRILPGTSLQSNRLPGQGNPGVPFGQFPGAGRTEGNAPIGVQTNQNSGGQPSGTSGGADTRVGSGHPGISFGNFLNPNSGRNIPIPEAGGQFPNRNSAATNPYFPGAGGQTTNVHTQGRNLPFPGTGPTMGNVNFGGRNNIHISGRNLPDGAPFTGTNARNLPPVGGRWSVPARNIVPQGNPSGRMILPNGMPFPRAPNADAPADPGAPEATEAPEVEAVDPQPAANSNIPSGFWPGAIPPPGVGQIPGRNNYGGQSPNGHFHSPNNRRPPSNVFAPNGGQRNSGPSIGSIRRIFAAWNPVRNSPNTFQQQEPGQLRNAAPRPRPPNPPPRRFNPNTASNAGRNPFQRNPFPNAQHIGSILARPINAAPDIPQGGQRRTVNGRLQPKGRGELPRPAAPPTRQARPTETGQSANQGPAGALGPNGGPGGNFGVGAFGVPGMGVPGGAAPGTSSINQLLPPQVMQNMALHARLLDRPCGPSKIAQNRYQQAYIGFLNMQRQRQQAQQAFLRQQMQQMQGQQGLSQPGMFPPRGMMSPFGASLSPPENPEINYQCTVRDSCGATAQEQSQTIYHSLQAMAECKTHLTGLLCCRG